MNKRKMAGQVRAGWSEWIRRRRKNKDEGQEETRGIEKKMQTTTNRIHEVEQDK